MTSAPRFSLIIPCYNEEKNLAPLVERCRAVFDGTLVEVILVDNGSTDGTARRLDELLGERTHIRFVRVKENQGYGFGILSGLREARGEFLGWTHADLQTDPGDFLQAVEIFEAAPAADRTFVKGRRRGRPLSDEVFSVGMGLFESALLGEALLDINAQPTAFHRSFFETWRAPPHDFSLDLFAYYAAKTNGLTVRRFDVKFGERLHGVSHWNVDWKSKKKFILRTVDYSLRLKRLNREAGR